MEEGMYCLECGSRSNRVAKILTDLGSEYYCPKCDRQFIVYPVPNPVTGAVWSWVTSKREKKVTGMRAEFMPRIRLTVENMKQGIIEAMGVRDSELGDVIEKGVDKALHDFPVEQETKVVVEEMVRSLIRNVVHSKVYPLLVEVAEKAVEERLRDLFSEGSKRTGKGRVKR